RGRFIDEPRLGQSLLEPFSMLLHFLKCAVEQSCRMPRWKRALLICDSSVHDSWIVAQSRINVGEVSKRNVVAPGDGRRVLLPCGEASTVGGPQPRRERGTR